MNSETRSTIAYCWCGCGQSFEWKQNRNGEVRRFFNDACRGRWNREQAERNLTNSLRTALKMRVRVRRAIELALEGMPE